jgi:hypothetical protein
MDPYPSPISNAQCLAHLIALPITHQLPHIFTFIAVDASFCTSHRSLVFPHYAKFLPYCCSILLSFFFPIHVSVIFAIITTFVLAI